jgi:hypothetical protein
MSQQPPPTPPSISALNLSASEEITLYKELIRILERDIDEIKVGHVKSGWTSWAIFGALVGAFSLLFGRLRGLNSFPTQNVANVVLMGMCIDWFARAVINIFRARVTSAVRMGKIRWSTDVHYPALPFILYSLVIQIIMIGITAWSPLPWKVRIPVFALFAYNTLIAGFVAATSVLKIPMGGGPISKKATPYFFLIIILLSGLSTAMLGTQLPVPLGESAVVAYEVGGLLTFISLLVGSLISTMAPEPLQQALHDLRNDIIFLRVDIDEALKRYETLTEGESLPDALKEDLAAVVADLDFLAYTHSNMATLLAKMQAALTDPNSSPEVVKQHIQDLKLDRDSFALHEKHCNQVLEALGEKLTKLNKKQARYAGVAEDWAAESNLRTSLIERLEAMRITHKGLLKKFNDLIRPPAQLPPQ